MLSAMSSNPVCDKCIKPIVTDIPCDMSIFFKRNWSTFYPRQFLLLLGFMIIDEEVVRQHLFNALCNGTLHCMCKMTMYALNQKILKRVAYTYLLLTHPDCC